MRQLVSQASWLVLESGACGAILLAAACGGSAPPQTRTETPSSSQAPAAARPTEKPFASGGTVEMHLDGGTYDVRPARGDAIRVTLGGNVGAANVDVSTQGTRANVLVKDTPRNNFQATIEVPQTADLVIRLAAGDLKVEAIIGNKDIESHAGNVNIVTGDAKDYASVDASVQAGDINANAFGESRSGLFSKFTWSGNGQYTLRARLIAGSLTLRPR